MNNLHPGQGIPGPNHNESGLPDNVPPEVIAAWSPVGIDIHQHRQNLIDVAKQFEGRVDLTETHRRVVHLGELTLAAHVHRIQQKTGEDRTYRTIQT